MNFFFFFLIKIFPISIALCFRINYSFYHLYTLIEIFLFNIIYSYVHFVTILTSDLEILMNDCGAAAKLHCNPMNFLIYLHTFNSHVLIRPLLLVIPFLFEHQRVLPYFCVITFIRSLTNSKIIFLFSSCSLTTYLFQYLTLPKLYNIASVVYT